MTLILFSDSYPYDDAAEQTFIEPELAHLCRAFDRVVIVPGRLKGGRCTVPFPSVEVDERFAKRKYGAFSKITLKYAPVLFLKLFWQDFLFLPNVKRSPAMLKKLLYFSANALEAFHYVRSLIKKEKIDLHKTIFYTYWLNWYTAGVGMVKSDVPSLKLASRAHSIDLYEERNNPPYLPCRKFTLKTLDRLFLISVHGKNYVVHKYPYAASMAEVSRLGVRDPGFLSQPSDDGVFRIFSCSAMVPVKRLGRLVEGLACFSTLCPGINVEWHHIGDGPQRASIEDKIQKISSSNFKHIFYGRIPGEQVYQIYKNIPVDIFVNVSASEGVPVAIMEALSCGIPVMATAVGGTPEIVSGVNGLLLPPDPSPQDIALSLKSMMENRTSLLQKKEKSREVWRDKCNAAVNYKCFAERMVSTL